MKIYVVLKDQRKINLHDPVIIVTPDRNKATDACIEYLKNENVGEEAFWKSETEFELALCKESSKEIFLEKYLSAWLTAPALIETNMET